MSSTPIQTSEVLQNLNISYAFRVLALKIGKLNRNYKEGQISEF